jgi:hypothetical protein
MDALRKMSLTPAQRLENSTAAARRKGRVQEGADTDLVAFDDEAISSCWLSLPKASRSGRASLRASTAHRQMAIAARKKRSMGDKMTQVHVLPVAGFQNRTESEPTPISICASGENAIAETLCANAGE